jgi:hypothetical protein
MRSLLAPLTLTIAVLAPAGVASASTISLDGTTMVYQGAPKASDVVVSRSLEFKDLLQPVTVGAGCLAGPPITCPGATSGEFVFGNRADAFRSFSSIPYTIDGNGGPDSIRAAGQWNFVHGGDGRDSIWENGNANGTVNGDDGDDRIYSFEASSTLHGDAGDDLVVSGQGTSRGRLHGDDGSDEIVARDGGGTATGGGGADTMVLDGALIPRAWTVDGGSGPDTIRTGTGQDAVTGGDGNDTIDVSGDLGSADTVTCGNGRDDTVYADDDDAVAGDCENVEHSTPVLAAVESARSDAAAFAAAIPGIPAF